MKKPILLILCLFACISWASGQQLITGNVSDKANGNPLPFVTVSLAGSSVSSYTDDKGDYSITVPSGNSKLQFSFVGYKLSEFTVGEQTVINVSLEPDAISLEEAVVVGYGSQKKSSIVGSVQSVKPMELKVPSTQLSTSFAGRLAGVVAVQRSGQPGADGADFWIRGISTFSGVTSPLIVIDGVQMEASDLNSLDPEVIESFTILKDATATAVYGSRGANGVMIITTKSGRDLEKPIINFRLENAFVSPTKTPKLADGVDYMKMFNEAVTNRGTGEILYTDNKIAGTIAGGDPLIFPNVDWYDEMFKNLAMNQNLNLNVRGGGKKADYFLSASLNHETGMMKSKSKDFFSYNNNINVLRYSFRNNLNVYLTPSTRVSLHMNTQIQNYNGPSLSSNDVFGIVMEANPVDFPILFPAGDPRENVDYTRRHIAWGGRAGGRYNDGYRNPMAEMVKGYATDFESKVNANIELNQGFDFLLKGLSANALISFANRSRTYVVRQASYNQYYVSDYMLDGSGALSSYKLQQQGSEQSETLETDAEKEKDKRGERRFYIEARLDFNRTFAKDHDVSAMLVYNQDEYNIANPVKTDNQTALIRSLPRRKQGIAGRASYAYKHRYMVEFNFGYNGSENFAKGRRFGFFPSVAAGYSISNEPFWEPLKKVVSNLKVRGSWGKVGNDQIGDQRFIYLSDIELTGAKYTTGIEMDHEPSGPVYKRYANNNITWEVGEKINVGVDVQLFNELNIMFDAFREVRTGIFMERKSIPNFLGTSGTKIYGNFGKVRNVGFDFAVDYNKKLADNLYLSLKGTFTYAKNTILERDEPAYMTYPNKSSVGHQINQPSMYIAERLFIDDAEVLNSPRQSIGGFVQGGDIKYTDQPNASGVPDGTIDANDMLYKGYPSVPQIVYGFGPSVKWKNWDFSCFFQGAAQTSLMMNSFHPFGSSSIRNSLQFVADDYWSSTNQNVYAAYPRLSKQDNANNTSASTYWLRDASFLKLKNAEIGYTYKFMRIYVNGSNLLTFSKFKLWDPEQGGGAGFKYPTQRVINIGIQMTL